MRAFLVPLALWILGADARANPCDTTCRDTNANCHVVGAFDSVRRMNCEENQATAYCQKHCGGNPGSSQNRNPAGDCGGATCHARASDSQKNGLDDLGNLSKDTRAEAARQREIQAQSIENANGILNRWDKSLRSGSEKGGPRDAWRTDQALVNRALQHFEGKGEFPPSVANGAKEGGIRRELSNYAQAKEVEEALNRQEEQNLRSIAALKGMNGQTLDRKSGMGSVDQNAARAARAAASSENTWDLTGGARRANGAADADAAAASSLSASPDRLDSAKYPDRAKQKDLAAQALKDRLRRGLASAGEKGADGQKAKEEGDASSDLTSGQKPGTEDPKAALDAFVNRAKASTGFSMNASETEREVRRLTGGIGGGAEQAAEGVLGADSTDLFQRVHQAHRQCEARECVLLAQAKK